VLHKISVFATTTNSLKTSRFINPIMKKKVLLVLILTAAAVVKKKKKNASILDHPRNLVSVLGRCMISVK